MQLSKVAISGVLILSLAGCGTIGGVRDRLFGTGGTPDQALPFRAKLVKGEDRRDFQVRVRAGGSNVGQVRESVRFHATRYCISSYGGSETDWQIDPATGDWAFSRDGDEMVFAGRCTIR